jgi:hypothetical protein
MSEERARRVGKGQGKAQRGAGGAKGKRGGKAARGRGMKGRDKATSSRLDASAGDSMPTQSHPVESGAEEARKP